MGGAAWVLNLDADVELAAIASGRPAYTPSARVLAAMQPQALRLASALLAPGDVLVDEATPPGAMRGREGRAFCPTPRALALLRRAGADAGEVPDASVLVRVNGRAFACGFGEELPGAAFVRDLDAARAHLAVPPPADVAAAWRIKRTHGMAGRGQRVVVPGRLEEADLALLRGGMEEGGVRIEPDVAIETELARHGMLARDGSVRLGVTVVQRCDARGQWLATERARAEAGAHEAELERTCMQIAHALHDAGYHGPFGVDAFTWRTRSGGLRFRACSEINARYAMGWPVGMR